jgi:hypothetical protein
VFDLKTTIFKPQNVEQGISNYEVSFDIHNYSAIESFQKRPLCQVRIKTSLRGGGLG